MSRVEVVRLIRLLLTGVHTQIEFTNMTSKYLPEHLSSHSAPENIFIKVPHRLIEVVSLLLADSIRQRIYKHLYWHQGHI